MSFYPFLGEGSLLVDYRKNIGHPYSNLSTGGPRKDLPNFRMVTSPIVGNGATGPLGHAEGKDSTEALASWKSRASISSGGVAEEWCQEKRSLKLVVVLGVSLNRYISQQGHP